MNPQQQRIKIAEACGWAIVGAGKGYPPYANKDRSLAYPPHKLPDYLNDLNAMREAEKVLTDEQLEEYFTRIHKNFSASQRAEAFLRTFNLWKP